ncbi:hypothetical protein FAVG1_00418 [Fusarium avenaceum]|nr:hypothetical protein FAVG1_00418 [Fusarium avenaceum]
MPTKPDTTKHQPAQRPSLEKPGQHGEDKAGASIASMATESVISRSASYPSHAKPLTYFNVPRPGLTDEQQIQTAEMLCRAQQGHEDGDGVG